MRRHWQAGQRAVGQPGVETFSILWLLILVLGVALLLDTDTDEMTATRMAAIVPSVPRTAKSLTRGVAKVP